MWKGFVWNWDLVFCLYIQMRTELTCDSYIRATVNILNTFGDIFSFFSHISWLNFFLIICFSYPPFFLLSSPGKLPNIFVSDWLWNQSNNTAYIKATLDILTFGGTRTHCPDSHWNIPNWKNFQQRMRRMRPQTWTLNSPAVWKIKMIVVNVAVVTCFLS